MTALVTGLLLGAVGSGHCVGMCGPLVLTIERSLRRPSRRMQLRHALTYHAGRVLTYVAPRHGSRAGRANAHILGSRTRTRGDSRRSSAAGGYRLCRPATAARMGRQARRARDQSLRSGWSMGPTALRRGSGDRGRRQRAAAVRPRLFSAADCRGDGNGDRRRGTDGRVRARDNPGARRAVDGGGIANLRHSLSTAPADAAPPRADRGHAPRARPCAGVRRVAPGARAFSRRATLTATHGTLSPASTRRGEGNGAYGGNGFNTEERSENQRETHGGPVAPRKARAASPAVRPATRPVCWSTQLDSLRVSPLTPFLRVEPVISVPSGLSLGSAAKGVRPQQVQGDRGVAPMPSASLTSFIATSDQSGRVRTLTGSRLLALGYRL